MPQVTKESFARALQALVRKYEGDRDTYLSSQYNEAQTRTQFISPLLEALGWDVRNEAGVPYNQCEVLEEKGETHGRPDYTFRLNGQTKFYLEAKSPSETLRKEDILQTKRYAWNSRDVFFAGVCDFEQFRFFDASLRPDEKRPLDGEAFHLIFSEYAESIDKLWELSRDRVAAGSLDQFLRKDRKSLLQKVPVDKDFLDNLTTWRHDLANAIHAQNHQYDAHQLNDIVQRLLDRIIFIRIAEDRKVIDQRQLWDIAVIWEESGGRRNILEQLVQVFQDFNTRFNGEIFKPHPCEEIKIESLALVKIIKQLYPPKSNYRFDVIGVELLGSIYERYLGNTLRITTKRVFIEPKPEVRKAGGVYYTPQYIVEYIVENTVGKLVEGKSPKEVDKIRILDPACGSGSFLIGAFQFLIDWYLNYYREHPKEAAAHGLVPMTRTDPDGNLRLSFYAKSLIIQHNLYGVDIDPQAVEVTMMSLYLKMLEGELGIQIPKQDKLPELKYNIRCGNSLIGPDIEKYKPLTPLERQRINPFNWSDREKGFGDILKSGGFDAVIGNPPYITYALGRGRLKHDDMEIAYIAQHYANSSEYKINSFAVFYEKALDLCRREGTCAYIVPGTILINEALTKIRRHLLASATVWRAVSLHYKVFADAEMGDCAILFVLKHKPDRYSLELVRYASQDWDKSGRKDRAFSDRVLAAPDNRIYMSAADYMVLSLATRGSLQPFGEVAQFYNGIKTGDNKKYLSDKRSSAKYIPVLRGRDFERYAPARPSTFVYFDPRVLWSNTDETKLGVREKILIRQTGDTLTATLDERGQFCMDTVHIIYSALADKRFLLGLLNSSFLNFYHGRLVPEFGKAFAEVKIANLKRLPVPRIRVSDAFDKARHDKVIALVERMLELNRKKHPDKLVPSELDRIEREISATDAEIDDLVYDLYGITDEERKIIEATE